MSEVHIEPLGRPYPTNFSLFGSSKIKRDDLELFLKAVQILRELESHTKAISKYDVHSVTYDAKGEDKGYLQLSQVEQKVLRYGLKNGCELSKGKNYYDIVQKTLRNNPTWVEAVAIRKQKIDKFAIEIDKIGDRKTKMKVWDEYASLAKQAIVFRRGNRFEFQTTMKQRRDAIDSLTVQDRVKVEHFLFHMCFVLQNNYKVLAAMDRSDNKKQLLADYNNEDDRKFADSKTAVRMLDATLDHFSSFRTLTDRDMNKKPSRITGQRLAAVRRLALFSAGKRLLTEREKKALANNPPHLMHPVPSSDQMREVVQGLVAQENQKRQRPMNDKQTYDFLCHTLEKAKTPAYRDFLVQMHAMDWPRDTSKFKIYDLGNAYDRFQDHKKRLNDSAGWFLDHSSGGLDTLFGLLFDHKSGVLDGREDRASLQQQYQAAVRDMQVSSDRKSAGVFVHFSLQEYNEKPTKPKDYARYRSPQVLILDDNELRRQMAIQEARREAKEDLSWWRKQRELQSLMSEEENSDSDEMDQGAPYFKRERFYDDDRYKRPVPNFQPGLDYDTSSSDEELYDAEYRPLVRRRVDSLSDDEDVPDVIFEEARPVGFQDAGFDELEDVPQREREGQMKGFWEGEEYNQGFTPDKVMALPSPEDLRILFGSEPQNVAMMQSMQRVRQPTEKSRDKLKRTPAAIGVSSVKSSLVQKNPRFMSPAQRMMAKKIHVQVSKSAAKSTGQQASPLQQGAKQKVLADVGRTFASGNKLQF